MNSHRYVVSSLLASSQRELVDPMPGGTSIGALCHELNGLRRRDLLRAWVPLRGSLGIGWRRGGTEDGGPRPLQAPRLIWAKYGQTKMVLSNLIAALLIPPPSSEFTMGKKKAQQQQQAAAPGPEEAESSSAPAAEPRPPVDFVYCGGGPPANESIPQDRQ